MSIIIVIGLGNPGNKFSNNRHNIGFQILDNLAEKNNLYFNERTLVHSHIAPFGEQMLLAKPDTFMNDSGIAARALVRNYDATITVVYDDITISIGDVKCSFGRGDGGHNGLTSIIAHLGHKNFLRIRVGIRPVDEKLLPRIAPPDGFEKFMLSDFTPMEKELKERGIAKAEEIIKNLPNKTIQEVMNMFN